MDRKRLRFNAIAVSANTLFRSLGPKIAIENATTTNLSIQVYLSDKKQHHSLFIRRGIVEHREEKTDKADLIFTVDSETWLLLVGQHLKWDAAKKENLLVVKGSDAKFKQFLTFY